MERVNVNVKTETTIAKFKSIDGQIFNNERDCKAYEHSLASVMWKRIISMGKQLSEYDFGMPFGCDDYCFRLIKVTKDNISDLNILIDLKSCYCSNRKVEEKDIGKVGVFYTNECDDETFGFYGTTEELLEKVAFNITL